MAARSKAPTSRGELLDRIRVGGSLDLDRHDPAETFGWDKEASKAELLDVLKEVDALQQTFFAEQRHSILVVLQAMDAAGKDGVLRDVLTGISPAGTRVVSFGVPNDEERIHDYLWRVHRHAPVKGEIGVFNRSHYEDVLVVRVKELVPKSVWHKRYTHIRNFERQLVDEGTAIVKIFLHLSKEEQRIRLQDRIDSPEERFKFRLGDLDDRKLWPDYMRAYRDALRRTSTSSAPWYVVPADRKWVRNLTVANILCHTLEQLDPQYPEPEDGIEDVVVI